MGPSSFAGACLGMLLGVLIGLSGSPVVGAVIAAILVAAGAYWSVAKVPSGATVPGTAAAALALACLIGVIGGLWVRAHDALSPSLQQDLQQWRAAGYSTARRPGDRSADASGPLVAELCREARSG